MNKRKALMRTVAVSAAVSTWLALLAGPVAAQTYPARSVRIIVPFAAGGPADNFARFMGQRLGDALGQAFVVENRPGGGSITGTDIAAKAAPDGYTLLMMSNTHTVNETLIPSKPFNLTRDFVGVAPINSSDLVLVAHPGVKANNLKEVIALAKANPGKVNYASSGPGTPYHMAGELFKSMAGVYLVHIPYRGSSGARTDIIGGQVELMFDAVTTMTEQVKAGKVKAIATSGPARSAVLPDVPTLDEAGVKGFDATIWLGLMAPKGTPKAVVDRLSEAVTRITSNPDVRAAWARQGAVPISLPGGGSSAEAFDRYIQADIEKWAKVIKTAGIKAD
jgi:tripartite-type tricarboxylate transporter receptor subunit TctC